MRGAEAAAILVEAFGVVAADLPESLQGVLGFRTIEEFDDGIHVIGLVTPPGCDPSEEEVYETSTSFTGGFSAVRAGDHSDRADVLFATANAVQDVAILRQYATGRAPLWPECPRHPSTHPLSVQVRPDQAGGEADMAYWSCPADEVTIAKVGRLG